MKQAGLTLIEMMVTALISVVVLQTFFQIFYANIETATYQEARAKSQTRAQFALFLMENDIIRAGNSSDTKTDFGYYNAYYNKKYHNSTLNTEITLDGCKTECDKNNSCYGFSWSTTACHHMLDTSLVKGSDGSWVTYEKARNTIIYQSNCAGVLCTSEGSGSASDTIGIVTDPSDDIDCIGTKITGSVINRYFIDDHNGKNGLFCESFNINDETSRGNKQLLVEGVQQLQLLYAYADNIKSSQYVTSYRTADEVTHWGLVKAVYVGLLIGGGNSFGANAKRSREYNLLGSNTLIIEDREPRYIYTMLQPIIANNASTEWRDQVQLD